jgi:hypothetical protein
LLPPSECCYLFAACMQADQSHLSAKDSHVSQSRQHTL